MLHIDKDIVFKSYKWLGQVLAQGGMEIYYSKPGGKDNPWIESLWSHLKEKAGQLVFDCQTLRKMHNHVNDCFDYYIHKRRHQ